MSSLQCRDFYRDGASCLGVLAENHIEHRYLVGWGMQRDPARTRRWFMVHRLFCWVRSVFKLKFTVAAHLPPCQLACGFRYLDILGMFNVYLDTWDE